MLEIMAKIYATLILKGLKTLADTPAVLREQVEGILNETEGED
jgi:hypothetical protein